MRGYRIEARRFRTPAGEIDIVARRGAVLAVIEVKARATLSAAAESLGPHQQARIIRAAESLLQARPRLAGLDVRFDIMLVRPWRLPVHLVDAWRGLAVKATPSGGGLQETLSRRHPEL